MTVRIAALAAPDHSRWLELARGYKAFYKMTEAEYTRAWQRLLANDRVWGLGAHLPRCAAGASRALYDKVAKYNNFIRYDYPLQLALI